MASKTFSNIFARAIRNVPAAPKSNNPIYLALSGGVDSSVSGLLLREKGWRVIPVLMKCWDGTGDDGPSCFEAESRAARQAVKALKLDDNLRIFDFVNEYWTNVFDNVLLSGFRRGETPNPDIACNAHVKFGAFPKRLRNEAESVDGKTTWYATGHYARTNVSKNGKVQLLSAVDLHKDQSYFLSAVSSQELESVIFPVGSLYKDEVQEIARGANLPGIHLKSSKGICFVGKRPLGPFLNHYMETKPGKFIDVDTGDILGKSRHPSCAYTIGQGAKIGGRDTPMFVVGKEGNNLIVAPQHEEWRLHTTKLVCKRADWVTREEPAGLRSGIRLTMKSSSNGELVPCFVQAQDDKLFIHFDSPQRTIATGQAAVLYNGEVCLGAAWPQFLNTARVGLAKFVDVA